MRKLLSFEDIIGKTIKIIDINEGGNFLEIKFTLENDDTEYKICAFNDGDGYQDNWIEDPALWEK